MIFTPSRLSMPMTAQAMSSILADAEKWLLVALSGGKACEVHLHGPVNAAHAWSCFPRRWLQLPDVGVWPQLPVLQSFQQIVELQESSRLLVDLGLGGRPDHPYGDLKVSAMKCLHNPTTGLHWQRGRRAGAAQHLAVSRTSQVCFKSVSLWQLPR